MMMFVVRNIFFVIITGINISFAQSLKPMIVKIEGLKEAVGQVVIAVFNNAEDFPTKRDKAIRIKKVPVTSSELNVLIEDVPSDTYGIAVYHDENSNNKMDRNWIGIPSEGAGASNDAKGSFGPPKFDDAKFLFKDSQDTVKIVIHY